MARGICKVCGCTDKDPCFNPLHGNCWWVDDTHELCSHCADPEIANDPETRHCINTTDHYNQSVAEILVCKNCKHWERGKKNNLADDSEIYGWCKFNEYGCYGADAICADFEEKEDNE